MAGKKYLWQEYLERFNYFNEDLLRTSCYPRKMIHVHSRADTVVLIHGLTDSPAMMMDLARHYHEKMGYNVYLPLLQGHGLKEPDGMQGVSLQAWKENVLFALQTAAAETERLSIGGLSTGGALAFYFGCLDARINHKIYLFSAALGLHEGWLGTLKEIFLLSPLCLPLGKAKKNLIGSNPYRYEHIPLNSARELVKLIREIEEIRNGSKDSYLSDREIFSAWSECDEVIDTTILAELGEISSDLRCGSFMIGREHGVAHASVVLKRSIYATQEQPGSRRLLEKANPVFDEMVAAMSRYGEISD